MAELIRIIRDLTSINVALLAAWALWVEVRRWLRGEVR